jgi:DNA-binding IclR family transcriptional regulator
MSKQMKPDEEAESGDLYLSPPVQRAARLLRHIGEGDAVINMSETARALGINRATLVCPFRTLSAERFIEPRPGGITV